MVRTTKTETKAVAAPAPVVEQTASAKKSKKVAEPVAAAPAVSTEPVAAEPVAVESAENLKE